MTGFMGFMGGIYGFYGINHFSAPNHDFCTSILDEVMKYATMLYGRYGDEELSFMHVFTLSTKAYSKQLV